MCNRKLTRSIFCIISSSFLFQQLSAQEIVIQSGARWVSSGAVHLVLSDVGFTNNGNFVSDDGTVQFTGSASSPLTVGGTTVTSFHNMIINRSAGDIQLQQNINITGSITMTSRHLLLGNYVADLGTNGTVTGESTSSSIVGSSTGSLNKTATLNAPVAVNPGNIGVEITSAANLGPTQVKRFNAVQAVSTLDNSISRYYDIIPTNNNTLDATLTFHYLDNELGALDESMLNVWSYTNTAMAWKFYSKLSANTLLNTVTKDHIDTLARFTLANNNINAVLAVKLLSFSVKQEGLSGKLNWITSEEKDNERFEIERASDGRNFSLIGSVRSRGDNNITQTYVFTDDQPGSINYYRLKMIDSDNTHEYSNIISLRLNHTFVNSVSVFPIPIRNSATVRINSGEAANCIFNISDASGNTVYTGSWKLSKGVNTLPLSMSQFAAGIYYLQVKGISLSPVTLYKD